jgi:hypothetical protein
VDLIGQLDDAIKGTKSELVEFVTNVPANIDNDSVGTEARKAGTILTTFVAVRDLFTEAAHYANS